VATTHGERIRGWKERASENVVAGQCAPVRRALLASGGQGGHDPDTAKASKNGGIFEAFAVLENRNRSQNRSYGALPSGPLRNLLRIDSLKPQLLDTSGDLP
jgi:hypothetical protein